MIFVTVGTQKFPFDRLLKQLDLLVASNKLTHKIVAQTGYSTYQPQHYSSFPFISMDEIARYYEECQILLTHSGTSSIMEGVKRKKKIIVVPRTQQFGEHVDDHQHEITEMFTSMNLVEPVYDMRELEKKVQRVQEKTYSDYTFGSELLLDSVDEFLAEIAVSKERVSR